MSHLSLWCRLGCLRHTIRVILFRELKWTSQRSVCECVLVGLLLLKDYNHSDVTKGVTLLLSCLNMYGAPVLVVAPQ